MTPLTLDAAGVAQTLGYVSSHGQPNTRLIYRLARQGRIPGPIDNGLSSTQWRWSRRTIEIYVNGVAS